MRIKVTSCSKRGDWYESLIGKTFEVEPTFFNYQVIAGFYKGKVIQREDIEKMTLSHRHAN
jgi:hypothetical protein